MEEVTRSAEMFTTEEARVGPIDGEAGWMTATRGHQTAAGSATQAAHTPTAPIPDTPSGPAGRAGLSCLSTITQPVFFLIEFCGTFLSHTNGAGRFHREGFCKEGGLEDALVHFPWSVSRTLGDSLPRPCRPCDPAQRQTRPAMSSPFPRTLNF